MYSLRNYTQYFVITYKEEYLKNIYTHTHTHTCNIYTHIYTYIYIGELLCHAPEIKVHNIINQL